MFFRLGVVGLPVRRPVFVSNFMPAGRPTREKLVGEFEAEMVKSMLSLTDAVIGAMALTTGTAPTTLTTVSPWVMKGSLPGVFSVTRQV